MRPTDDAPAIEVGARRGRWLSAAGWSGLVLVPALVVARLGGHAPVILGLGLVVAAGIFVAAVREKPTVVTRDEVRYPRRTIRREHVTTVTQSGESTAFVFRGPGGVVGIGDLFGRSDAFREALLAQGWPCVDLPA